MPKRESSICGEKKFETCPKPEEFLWRNIPGTRNVKCKGPKPGAYVINWTNSKKASVAGGERTKGV